MEIKKYKKRLNFSPTVIEKLSEAEFYKAKPNKDGELKKNDRYYFLALGLLNFIAIPPKNKKAGEGPGKYIGSRILKEFSEDRYLGILGELLRLGIVLEHEKPSKQHAGRYGICPAFEGSCRLMFSNDELDLIDIKFKKQAKRGKRATTDKRISIDLNYNSFVAEMTAYGKSEKNTIDKQWEIIKKINETGKINPVQFRESRLYSRFTELSKPVNSHVVIDGDREISEADLHASYFTLLPYTLRAFTIRSKHQNLENDIEALRIWIDSCTDIYLEIASEINLKGITREDIKKNVLKWLCNPLKSELSKTQKIIDAWFLSAFPYCSRALDSLRPNKIFSRRVMKVEQSIFVSCSKTLKKMNIDCLTKHDCLIFRTKDKNQVLGYLNNTLDKMKISKKLTVLDYNLPSSVVASPVTNFGPPLFQNTSILGKVSGPIESSETPILSAFGSIEIKKTAHTEKRNKKERTILCGFFENVSLKIEETAKPERSELIGNLPLDYFESIFEDEFIAKLAYLKQEGVT